MSGRALLVIQIDQDFERRLLSGRQADIQVIADGSNSNTAGTAVGYVGGSSNRSMPVGEANTASDLCPFGSRAEPGTIPTWKLAGT